MGDVLRKIEEIEAEMARTQKNKATSAHLGQLKAKLAKLRRELITPKSQGGSAKEESFEVAKTGDSRIGESDSLTPHYAMTMTIVFQNLPRICGVPISGQVDPADQPGGRVQRGGCL